LYSTSPSAARRSMEDFRDCMRGKYTGFYVVLDEIGSHVERLSGNGVAGSLCGDGQLKSEVPSCSMVQLNADLQWVEAISDETKVINLLLGHWR
jgi:hypothetical protein